MKRMSSQSAFLLVGVSHGDPDNAALADLVGWFEQREWPIAFVMEPGPRIADHGRPRAGDLIIQTHGLSLPREPIFMNLYKDFGEPKLVLAGTWDRNVLIATVVDCYLSGFAAGLAHDACRVVRNDESAALDPHIAELLGGFSYAVSDADLQERERSWWF